MNECTFFFYTYGPEFLNINFWSTNEWKNKSIFLIHYTKSLCFCSNSGLNFTIFKETHFYNFHAQKPLMSIHFPQTFSALSIFLQIIIYNKYSQCVYLLKKLYFLNTPLAWFWMHASKSKYNFFSQNLLSKGEIFIHLVFSVNIYCFRLLCCTMKQSKSWICLDGSMRCKQTHMQYKE